MGNITKIVPLPSMYDCPKFDSCSAPICPLFDEVDGCTYSDGEAICFYLREYAKGCPSSYDDNEKAILRMIRQSWDALKNIGGYKYAKRLERANTQSSKRPALSSKDMAQNVG